MTFSPIKDNKKPPVYKFLLDGNWQTSQSRHLQEIVSPLNQKVIGKTQVVTFEEINLAYKAAKKAQSEWAQVPLDQRIKTVRLAADWIDSEKKTLAGILNKEIAKSKKSSLSEIERTVDLIHYFCDQARTIKGEELRSDNFPGFTKDKIALIEKAPHGVILAISPFNYPVNLSASKIAPALLTGNALIFKPSTHGTIISLHLAHLFVKAGLPSGLLNVITGPGSVIGDYLASHNDNNMITFTGSSQVGKRIATRAGMIPLLFECGGNNPVIVCPDADLNLTAEQIVKGAFSYAGQRCTGVKYVLLEDKTQQKLLPKVVSLAKKTTVEPVISLNAAKIILKRIKEAKNSGAKIKLGNKAEKNKIPPTILTNVTPDMEIVKTETFGPVVSFIKIDNLNQAVKIINHSSYGLQASIFTKDEGTAIKLAQKLEVGTIQINSNPQRGPDHFPFLGIKDSGVGTQGVKYTLEAMTRPKPVIINEPQ